MSVYPLVFLYKYIVIFHHTTSKEILQNSDKHL